MEGRLVFVLFSEGYGCNDADFQQDKSHGKNDLALIAVDAAFEQDEK
ncbi:hypothetical protein Echvi_1996 [Echinicola vietnamensis DSM 17526]|uniref:Uncharacterized protein n=1 Tax=Echinicola vietnamensis (strain DSM 17526 / LMG 23754 / KMM 6221) TaxID=926556 RepID=L0FWG8_ECHVK|nr:hypothetical protein Echvi_1996 [Echinicola vietnamensis DSM 17526]